MWDLFATAPLMLYHPNDLQIVIAGVTKSSHGWCTYWNADYLACINKTGMPGSGFADYRIEKKPRFDKKTGQWVFKTWGEGHRFSCELPRDVLQAWDANKQWIPTLEELQEMQRKMDN